MTSSKWYVIDTSKVDNDTFASKNAGGMQCRYFILKPGEGEERKKDEEDSYLKSFPILLPLSGIPGSGHMLCPWDTPTCVTTRQKNSTYRDRIEDKIYMYMFYFLHQLAQC